MIVAPAAIAMDLKTVSPQRPSPCFKADPFGSLVGFPEVCPTCCGLVFDVDEPTAVESGVTAIEFWLLRRRVVGVDSRGQPLLEGLGHGDVAVLFKTGLAVAESRVHECLHRG